MFSATGKQAQDGGNELSRDDFDKCQTFFGFDLTPDGCDGGCFHLTRKDNLCIENALCNRTRTDRAGSRLR